jgi:hypothetical protein
VYLMYKTPFHCYNAVEMPSLCATVLANCRVELQ